MSAVVILVIFVSAFVVAVLAGPGWAFVAVYLPTLIMLNQLPPIAVPHLPLLPEYAPIIAIFIAAPFSVKPLRFRWNIVDTIVGLCLLSAVITALNTGEVETGINILRNEILRWVGPYYLARATFGSIEIRRLALRILIGLLGVLAVAALIEFRLTPYFYLHMLQNLGMGNSFPPMAYSRFGFFRVSGSDVHPIYFGNMCVILMGMVAVLAKTTGTSLKNPWVALAIFAAFGCVVTSISFTPYVGMIAGIAILLTLLALPWARYLVVPLVLIVVTGVTIFTYNVAHEPLGTKQAGDLNGSYYTRRLIVVESWRRAETAGAFGYGPKIPRGDGFDLTSVDNSYMLFTMTRGYVYTILWIMLGVTFAIRTTRGFLHVTHRSQVFPLAAGFSTIFALMLSMYTVWGGAIYVVVWAVMLGMSNTIVDLVIYPQMRLEEQPAGRKSSGSRMVSSSTGGSQGLPGLKIAQAGVPVGRR